MSCDESGVGKKEEKKRASMKARQDEIGKRRGTEIKKRLKISIHHLK